MADTNFFSFFGGKKKPSAIQAPPVRTRDNSSREMGTFQQAVPEETVEKQSFMYDYGRSIFSFSYTGEKNFGELGPIKDYRPEYQILRIRSWQAFFESEVAQAVIKRFQTWVIGKGLKLQSEPEADLLKEAGINVDANKFSKNTEARYRLFKKSKRASYSRMMSLNALSKEAHKNAIIGGDVLVVLRYEKKKVTVQLIDGAHVQTPLGSEYFPTQLPNGNRIINGIEISPTGEHVRFYVKNADQGYQPIEARGKQSGLQMAFMVYGLRYRLDNVRGIPLIAVVMETIKKMERYKEAALASAEEAAKIAFVIEHELNAEGKNPFLKNMSRAIGSTKDFPTDVNGRQLADHVAASFNKTVVNLTPGSKLKAAVDNSARELAFGEFYDKNVDIICMCINIPPDVATSKYNGNFSASRAALKDWENNLFVERDSWAEQFEQPIYNFWLETQILENKIEAPGYIAARLNGDEELIECYQNARFTGMNVPHIDPMKEVSAERAKLGLLGQTLPLGTATLSTEALGTGEYNQNVEKFIEEKTYADQNGLVPPVNNDPKQNKGKDGNT